MMNSLSPSKKATISAWIPLHTGKHMACVQTHMVPLTSSHNMRRNTSHYNKLFSKDILNQKRHRIWA